MQQQAAVGSRDATDVDETSLLYLLYVDDINGTTLHKPSKRGIGESVRTKLGHIAREVRGERTHLIDALGSETRCLSSLHDFLTLKHLEKLKALRGTLLEHLIFGDVVSDGVRFVNDLIRDELLDQVLHRHDSNNILSGRNLSPRREGYQSQIACCVALALTLAVQLVLAFFICFISTRDKPQMGPRGLHLLQHSLEGRVLVRTIDGTRAEGQH
mmetsp:Transcript_73347/g.122523  ORF Transcript_73347/g.122523 Transcript_73347/m.122523 type:complete len:214 (-) Transcript_73347:917-1558(-)